MKYAMGRPIKVVMLGVGGTGGYIARDLYRILHSTGRPVRFIICDGDNVEAKNLVRQNFIEHDLNRNKAQVLAERYASAFGMEVEFIPQFIEDESRLAEIVTPDRYGYSHYAHDSIEEHVILIGAVDNHKSRKMCDSVFRKAKNLIYIDSGNGEHSGQIVCGLRRKGRTYYKPVADLYPEILETDEDDKFPSELSCADAALAAPQSIAANLMAATAVVCMVYRIITEGTIEVQKIFFNTNLVQMQPTIHKKRRTAA